MPNFNTFQNKIIPKINIQQTILNKARAQSPNQKLIKVNLIPKVSTNIKGLVTFRNTQPKLEKTLKGKTMIGQLKEKANNKVDVQQIQQKKNPAYQDFIDYDINISQFKIEQEIGKGSFAIVKLATNKSNLLQYALKIYPRFVLLDPIKLKNVRREITVLKKIEHPGIIKLHYAIEDNQNQIVLIMEYIGKLSLNQYLKLQPGKKLQENEIKKIFKQIIQGIHYCHEKNIVHRDIKLENIMLDANNNVKIIDFGFSLQTPENNKKLNIFCGTPSYMAPEIVSKIEYLGHKSDIWALGVLLFVMSQGKFPFKGITDRDLYAKIRKGQFSFCQEISTSLQNLICKMMNLNPDERPNTIDILQDEWIQE